MRRVVIESPFGTNIDGTPADAATIERNREYLDAAMRDSFGNGEAPFASHRLYPGVLRDEDPRERRLGMEAGFLWGECAERVIVYGDLGVTKGMREGVARARAAGIPVEYRTVPGWGRP